MQGWRSRPFWKKKLSNCCRKWRRVRGSWGGAGTALKGWVDGWTVGLWAIPSSRPEAWCEADPDKKGWQGEMEGERVFPVFYLLLLLLSHISRVWLCATPWTAAHQAPPSLGFFSQEHWVGCHFLLQRTKVKSESEVAQACPTLSDPMDCSLPGSSVHGIFQAYRQLV